MRVRIVGVALGLLLLALAAPASANHTYSGRATATGLKLTVQPAGGEEQGITIGFTDAKVQSGPLADGCEGEVTACASAAAALEPFGTTVTATAPGNPGPHSSTAFALPAPLDQILDLDVGLGTARAAHEPNAEAVADAAVSTIGVTLTQTLVDQVPQIQQGLDQLADTLGPVLERDPTGQVGPRVKGVLDQIVANVASAPLATITAGPSTSTAVDVHDGLASATTATATSQGGVITLLPTNIDPALPGGEGLVIIEVGAATATATSNQLTATADFDPAIVRARVFDPATGQYQAVAIETGQPKTCLGQAPVLACVGAGSGTTTTDGAAAAGEAQAVIVELFEAPLPKITLALAIAAAGVNAAPPPPAPPVPAEELPKTGADVTVPAAALLGAGALAFASSRKRRVR